MQIFKLYFKQRIRVIAVFLAFGVLFTVSFALYGLPIAAVLYPSILCVLIGLVILAIDFAKVRKKHMLMLRMQSLSAAMMEQFPEIGGLDDADYQSVIKALQAGIRDIKTAANADYADMMDYYTVWAHLIKTPIASIKLKLQNDDSSLSHNLTTDLPRIDQYVDMVLAYLRLDSTSSDYVLKEYSVDSVVKQSVRRFASEFINRKISLRYEPLNVTVITDEKWFCFVIEQILSNALKYTDEGGTVSIYMTNPKTLCIEDTGIGISPEDLPRIFEKGFTGYNGRSDKRASGIGLYLCKRICSKLGAEITASSRPDEGTVIRIDL